MMQAGIGEEIDVHSLAVNLTDDIFAVLSSVD